LKLDAGDLERAATIIFRGVNAAASLKRPQVS
jgi:hypothetical protein